MNRHWRIRIGDKDEYVTTSDEKPESQLEQVVTHCLSKGYELGDVVVIETATKSCFEQLLLLLKTAIGKLK